MNVELEVTTNFRFLRDNWEKFSIFVLEGSTRSGKTIAILQWLVGLCLATKNLMVRCVRYDSTTHTESTLLDIELVLNMYSLEHGIHYSTNRQQKKFIFFNGASITFSATNDVAKLHGMPSDVLWLNECMEIPYESYKQLKNRTRLQTIMDFNPSFSRHWVFRAILNENGKRPDHVAYKHTTYENNPFLSNDQIYSIESANPKNPENVERGTADEYEWNVYGLGKRGKVKGAVFENWDITDYYPPEPRDCQRWGYGLDFGYTVDPSAMVEVCLHQNKLFVREIFYETKLLVTKNASRPMEPSILGMFEKFNIDKNAQICAESAQPESCATLNLSGYNICPVKKGKGSVLAGINILKNYRIFVHQSSFNLINELQAYVWKKQTYRDHEPALRPEPIDLNNHLIDGLRYYAIMNLFLNPDQLKPAHLRRKNGGRPNIINRARSRKRL